MVQSAGGGVEGHPVLRNKGRLARGGEPGLETPIGMEERGVERTSQEEQNVGQVAPPTQLGPDELGLEKNELHHLA